MVRAYKKILSSFKNTYIMVKKCTSMGYFLENPLTDESAKSSMYFEKRICVQTESVP